MASIYVLLKIFKNKSLIGDSLLDIDSIDPGWESNPGHLFRYHTTRPPRFTRQQKSDCIYHMYAGA